MAEDLTPINDSIALSVDHGDDDRTVLIMAIARASSGELVVLHEQRLEVPPGVSADDVCRGIVDMTRALERTGAAMDGLKDALAAVRLSQFDPGVAIVTGLDIERIARTETTRYYTNPPASSTTMYYCDDPDIQKAEDLAVRTHPTTNARGRWRRVKTRRCMKCNAIVNDGQTCCHRCGSKRIQ